VCGLCCSECQCVAMLIVSVLQCYPQLIGCDRIPNMAIQALQYVELCCSALQCAAVCYSEYQCVPVCYSVLQCVVVRCSALQ